MEMVKWRPARFDVLQQKKKKAIWMRRIIKADLIEKNYECLLYSFFSVLTSVYDCQRL